MDSSQILSFIGGGLLAAARGENNGFLVICIFNDGDVVFCVCLCVSDSVSEPKTMLIEW